MKILITGGTGSLGQALVARWHKTHTLTILSRNPHKQQALQEKYHLDPSAFILADIGNSSGQLLAACANQDMLIHAAALKTVAQGETHPSEYLRVNAIGSEIVAQAWAIIHPDNRMALYINSDKAVSPINHYGVTKKIGEKAFVSRGFSSIRYGNVVMSEGSFIHKWQMAQSKGLPIKVRIPYPTRFLLSFDQALEIIDATINVMAKGRTGIFVPNNPAAFDINDVALALTDPVNICYEMLQSGEKQHEVLIDEGETIEVINEIISGVTPGRSDTIPDYLCSATAVRLTGSEVLSRLHISPLQKVFA